MNRRYANTLTQSRTNSVDNSRTEPAGVVKDYAGGTVPTGYLACNGASLATADYPDLFAAIGYTWGGAGASFNVPNFNGRATIGDGSGAGITTRTVGQSMGAETHQLVTAELASHAHTAGGLGTNTNVHGHRMAASNGSSGGPAVFGIDANGNGGKGGRIPTADNDSHSHTVTGNTGDIASITPNQPHNNMQPSAVVKKMIKY